MFKTTISLLASVLTILTIRMAGKGDQRFNIVGLVNCGVWIILTMITTTWGLMPMNLALTWTYAINLRNWRKSEL